jgi:hypothetical protein
VRDGDDATLNFCPNTLNSYFDSANVSGQTVRPSLNKESVGFRPVPALLFLMLPLSKFASLTQLILTMYTQVP